MITDSSAGRDRSASRDHIEGVKRRALARVMLIAVLFECCVPRVPLLFSMPIVALLPVSRVLIASEIAQ